MGKGGGFNPVNTVTSAVSNAVNSAAGKNKVFSALGQAAANYYTGASGLAAGALGTSRAVQATKNRDYLGIAASGSTAQGEADPTATQIPGAVTAIRKQEGYKGLAAGGADLAGNASRESRFGYDALSGSLVGADNPGNIGGDLSGVGAPPTEDPEAIAEANRRAEEQRRPKGITSTIFAGLNTARFDQGRKSARKTLLGY